MTKLYYTEQEITASIDNLLRQANALRELSLEHTEADMRQRFIAQYANVYTRINELEDMIREKQIEHAMKMAAV